MMYELPELQVSKRGGSISLHAGIDIAANMILSANKVIIIGNGGSAAIASHMRTDLCLMGVRAMAFDGHSLLTALANDYGYNEAFERLVMLWADHNDLLIAISSSGQSENILGSVRSTLASIITFSGFEPDNPLRSEGFLNFYVPSLDYGVVEVSHSISVHFLTDCVKESMND